jgi:hypothetical protein
MLGKNISHYPDEKRRDAKRWRNILRTITRR